MMITKKMNTLGYLFIAASYTAGVVMLTLHYANQPNQGTPGLANDLDNKNEIKFVENALREEIAAVRRESAGQIELQKLRESILSEVNAMSLKYMEEIKKRKQPSDISDVKSEAMVEEFTKGAPKALSYNNVNEKLLRKKHQLDRKRLKKSLKEEREAFMATLDMSADSDRERWESYLDLQSLKLAEQEARQLEESLEFQEEKYIVVENL